MGKQVPGAYASENGLPDGSAHLAVYNHHIPTNLVPDTIEGYWLVDEYLLPTLERLPRSRRWRIELHGRMQFAVWTEPASEPGIPGRRHYLQDEIWKLLGNDPPPETHYVGFINLDSMDCRGSNLCTKWLPRAIREARGLIGPSTSLSEPNIPSARVKPSNQSRFPGLRLIDHDSDRVPRRSR